MIRSGRSMLGLGAALAAAAAIVRVGPESADTPDSAPSLLLHPSTQRPRSASGVRGSSGPRVLGPPETAAQMEAAMDALLKRLRRLERNRRTSGSDTA